MKATACVSLTPCAWRSPVLAPGIGGLDSDRAQSLIDGDAVGSLAPGKIANLTVLEQDPYAIAPEKLKAARPPRRGRTA